MAVSTDQSPNQLIPAADFQALPLEFIISQPLVAVVKAQAVAAEATKTFITQFIKNGTPIKVEFNAEIKDSAGVVKSVSIAAPILSMIPIPHLRIDSLTIDFKYEISQTLRSEKEIDKGADITAETGAFLSPWVKASLKGHVSSTSKQESVMNRSGMLEITIHASESPIPEGLAKVLNFLSDSIIVKPTT